MCAVQIGGQSWMYEEYVNVVRDHPYIATFTIIFLFLFSLFQVLIIFELRKQISDERVEQ